MKKLFITAIMISFVGVSSILAQCNQDYFELLLEPTITETDANGNTLKAVFEISLYNATIGDAQTPLDLYTMQNAIGLTAVGKSVFSSHTGQSAEMASGSGAQVANDEFELTNPVNYNGNTYTDWIVYGHTVNGSPGFGPQVIPFGDTAVIASITMNLNGTMEFTDDPNNSSLPYIGDPGFFAIFPGNSIQSIPLVLNNFGTRFPNGFPKILSCYQSRVEG
ncbi:MAG: hypothetical protein AAGK97_07090, partial [Bacteroidota bacterium]